MQTNFKALAAEVESALKRRDVEAAQKIFASVEGDIVGFVNVLRDKGVLRFSRFDFRETELCKVLDHLLAMEEVLRNEQICIYLRSLNALVPLAKYAARLLNRCLKRINARSFKGYFAALDSLFLKEIIPNIRSDPKAWKGYSREEIAEGFSYYAFSLWQKSPPTEPDTIRAIDSVRLDHYFDILADFAKLRELREVEFQVEVFGHVASLDGKRVRLSAPDENVEKAERFGYVISELQQSADIYRYRANDLPSLVDIAERYIAGHPDVFFERVSEPFERIRTKIPLIPEILSIFQDEGIYSEEWADINITQKNLFVNDEEFRSKEIAPGITLLDVLRFQRVFRLLAVAFQKYSESEGLLDSPTYFRSLIPVFDPKSIDFLFTLLGKERTEGILEMFKWDPNSKKVFDIQYQPFVQVGKILLAPMGLISRSNLPRNALQQTGFRFDSESESDPIGDLLDVAFEGLAQTVRSTKYSFAQHHGEIDFLIFLPPTLFAFECKNSLHPCTPFELRQTWNYIQTAVIQLNRFRDLWQVESFRHLILSRLKITIDEPVELATGIIMGTRMFAGYEPNGHPIRPVHETCNVVTGGSMTMVVDGLFVRDELKTGKLHFTYCAGRKVQREDLLRYLSHQSLYGPAFKAMKSAQRITHFGGHSVFKETFLWSYNDFLEALWNLPGATFVASEHDR